jgi:hypothetical protein
VSATHHSALSQRVWLTEGIQRKQELERDHIVSPFFVTKHYLIDGEPLVGTAFLRAEAIAAGLQPDNRKKAVKL